MSNTVKINKETYFITTTVVDWMDIFTRPKYKRIVLESLEYCQKHKGLEIYAWVLMTNHLHAIVSAKEGNTVADIMRDFKKFTSKKILEVLKDDNQESRREWLLDRFNFVGANDKKIKNSRLWKDGYHPELVCTHDFYRQKLDYIHNNPVRQEFVLRKEDFLYSSAIDYAGGKGLLDVIVTP